MSSSPNAMSPSRNSISNWLKLLKKSDSSNEVSSPQSSSFNLNINTSSLDLNDTSQQQQDTTPQDTSRLAVPIPIKTSISSPRKNSNPLSLTLISPQKNTFSTPQTQQQSAASSSQHSSQQPALSSSPTPTRPFLGFKSRSSHSFRPLSQFLDSSITIHHDDSANVTNNSFSAAIDDNSKERLRSHRDSFLQQRQLDAIGNSSIFGCDIETSTKLAHGTIYIAGDIENDSGANNSSVNGSTTSLSNNYDTAYGQVPLVIVSCGSYLKANALTVEGIFRLSGSNKRVKHLQMIFSTPPDYGSKIDWDGYTVHDAASLLRRYLSSLSEPLIPFNLYQSFRNPLIEKKELYTYLKEKDIKNSSYDKPDKQKRRVIISQRRELLKKYAELFKQLPPIQHRVLFYLVDMLAMFNLKSEKNRMPAKNLAAIFQPSILFHPDHDMNPDEYASNSLVIEFMITYSHKILVNVHNKPKKEKNEEPVESRPESNRPRKESTYSLSKLGSEDCEKIDEEVDEPEDAEETTTKPSTVIESASLNNSINSKAKPFFLSSDRASPLKGSPLKHMFTPLDDRSKILGLDNLDAPVTLFANTFKTRARPHSKSLSHVPHSEVVRISHKTSSITSNSNAPESNDYNLSRVVSNQSGVSSLVSSKIDTDNTTAGISQSNIDNTLVGSTGNNLIKELGLPQPDIIHRSEITSKINSTGSKSDVSSLSVPHLVIEDDPNKYTTTNVQSFIPPITPTTESTMSRDDTPDVEDLCDNTNNTSTIPEITVNPLMYDLKNASNDETDSKEEFYSLGNEKQSELSTTSAFESDSMVETGSLPFSIQPSLLQGHRSTDDVNSNTVRGHILPTTKLSSPLSNFKKVQYSHPDIVSDPSLLRKTATTPSIGSMNASINDEPGVITVKKRSNSTTNNNQLTNKSSGLFSMVATHIPNTSSNRNTVSSSERETQSNNKDIFNKEKNRKESNVEDKDKDKGKGKDKGKEKNKEKHTWFGKFKPRSSNTKR